MTSPVETLQSLADFLEWQATPETLDATLERYAHELFPLVELGDLTEEMIRTKLKGAATATAMMSADAADQLINRGFARGRGEDPDKPLWGKPEPFPSRTHPAPGLDPDLLPLSLKDWIVDESSKASMPLEFVAVPAMVALGTVLGRKVAIQPEDFEPQWIVPCNLWGAIVGEPGVRKSSAAKIGMKHLRPIERDLFEEFDATENDLAARRLCLEAKINAAKRQKDPNQEEISEWMQSLAKIPAGPKRIRTNDATQEKIGCMLVDNPTGLLIEADEMSGWFKNMDRAGRESDRGFFLTSWSGDQPHSVDRMSRPSIHIKHLCLSVFGTLQPGPLSEYLAGAASTGKNADGMIQRLQLLVWPDNPPHWQKVTRPPNVAACQRAEGVYRRLFQASPLALGASCREGGGDTPACLFSPQGQAVYDRWHASHEARIEAKEFGSRPAFESHMCKYRSLMPKLAYILHLADNSDGSPVGELAAMRAVGWVRWLEQHAKKVYVPAEPAAVIAARNLAEKIQTGAVASGSSVRDIYLPHWKGLDDKPTVDLAISKLCEMGWIKVITKATKGRPKRIVEFNPCIDGDVLGL